MITTIDINLGLISNCRKLIAGSKRFFLSLPIFQVKLHMDIHLNLRPYQCPECGHRGNWKWDVTKHLQTRHPNCQDPVITLSREVAKETLLDYLNKKEPSKEPSPGPNTSSANTPTKNGNGSKKVRFKIVSLIVIIMSRA